MNHQEKEILFNKMPTPRPKAREDYQEFIARFMRNKLAQREYPKQKQRFAVAISLWKEYH